VRRGIEYPAVLPESPVALVAFTHEMLFNAAAFATAELWESLDARISRLIAARKRENSILKVQIDQDALTTHDSDERVKEDGAVVEALQFSHVQSAEDGVVAAQEGGQGGVESEAAWRPAAYRAEAAAREGGSG
jgi:hypothetical protein